MAGEDFTFEIKADPSTAVSAGGEVEKSMDRITAKASQASRAVQDVGGRFQAAGNDAKDAAAKTEAAVDGAASHISDLIALAAGAFSIHELAELADGYTEIGNRLRVVSTDEANLNGLMEATLGIAQDTRSEWNAVASVYQRLSNVTSALGLSQRDVLDLTKEMAEGAKISGATSRESAMAMGEVTHAFEVGVLQGREYKVMMRDVPALMHELQIASGKTGSEFAEMGKHGRITAEMLIDWFHKADASIEDKFAKTVPTISDMLTKLHNEAERFFGETATGSGIMAKLGEVTDYVIKHFDDLARIVLAVGEALLGLYVIDKIIGMVKMLTAAIAENPLGALITATVIAVSLLRQFGDQMVINAKSGATVADVLAVLWEKIKALATAIEDFVENAWHSLTDAFSSGIDSTGIELSMRNVMIFFASFVDAAIGLFKFLGDSIVTVFGGIPVMIAGGFIQIFKVLTDLFDALLNKIIDGLNAVVGVINGISNTVLGGINSKAITDAKNLPPEQREAFLKQNLVSKGPQIPEVPHVDLTFQNPLADSPGAFLDKFKEDWNKDVKGTTVTKDMVNSFFDEVDKHARDRAASAKEPVGATISTTRGAKEPRSPTDAELKALEKLKNELRTVMEQSNPVTEAQVKLAHAQDIVTKAVDAGLISWAQGETAMENYRRKLQDALDPFDAWIRKQLQAAAALNLNKDVQKLQTEMEAFEQEMKQKGIVLTDIQLRQAKDLLASNNLREKQLQNEQTALEAIQAPLKNYREGKAALDSLLAKGVISARDYARAIEEVEVAYAGATNYGKTFEFGVLSGLRAIRDQTLDVASTVKTAMVDAFNKVNDAIVQMATTGKANWHDLVNSIISDLTKLILKQIEAMLIMTAINALTGGGASAANSATGGAVQNGIANNLPGFATGGSFMVGGRGGTDSQVVAFRATPGEHVQVSTKGTGHGSGGEGPQGAHLPLGVKVINTYDQRAAALEAMNSRDGEQLVLNVIAKNASVVRGHVNRR